MIFKEQHSVTFTFIHSHVGGMICIENKTNLIFLQLHLEQKQDAVGGIFTATALRDNSLRQI